MQSRRLPVPWSPPSRTSTWRNPGWGLLPGAGGAELPKPLAALCPPSYLTSLAQKTPSASFEELFPLAEDAAEVFSQCCDSTAEDCMQKKVGEEGNPPPNPPPEPRRGLRGRTPPWRGGLSRALSPAHPPLPSWQLSEHVAKVCGALSARDSRFAGCCKGTNLMQTYFCISSLPPAPAPELPEAPKPTNEQVCSEEGALHAKR